MSAIYIVDVSGALEGPLTFPVVPGVGRQIPSDAVELPAELATPAEGFAWALVDGEPVVVVDYRGTVYSTADGAASQHGALGALPEGFTEQAWPGRFYVWSGEAWVLDEAAQLEAAQEVERGWRNAQIAASDYLAMPDYPITDGQRVELYAYRQSLRNWPAAGPFPEKTGRPSPPAWFADLSE